MDLMAVPMIDVAIVLIGLICFASIMAGRHLFLGSEVQTGNGTERLLRQRKFTRFMHTNLTIAGAAIALVLLSQAPRVDPSLTATADQSEALVIN